MSLLLKTLQRLLTAQTKIPSSQAGGMRPFHESVLSFTDAYCGTKDRILRQAKQVTSGTVGACGGQWKPRGGDQIQEKVVTQYPPQLQPFKLSPVPRMHHAPSCLGNSANPLKTLLLSPFWQTPLSLHDPVELSCPLESRPPMQN